MAKVPDIDIEEQEFYFHDLRLVALVATVACFLLVYLVLLPILKFRLASTIVFVSSIGSGAAVIYCLLIPDWLLGSVIITSPLSYWSPHKLYDMEVGVHIGLSGTNITINAVHESKYEGYGEEYAYFDEYFPFGGMEHMVEKYTEAKIKGLPGPMLTVMDYLTSGAVHGFAWPFRMADCGYYCVWLLSALLMIWAYLHVLFIAVTRYGAYVYTGFGMLLFLCNVLYWCMLPKRLPKLYIEGQALTFRLGACYYTCFSLATWCSASGMALICYDYKNPRYFTTNFNLEEDAVAVRVLKKLPKEEKEYSIHWSPRSKC